MTHEVICKVCRRGFAAKRSDAMYCGPACKVKAHRQSKAKSNEIPAVVSNPPLRWLGGKWKLGTWIMDHFPPHVAYVEPFAGGANVLLQKPPSEVEVLNDLNSDIVNFFDMLRTRPEELIRAICFTPYSREIHERAHEPCTDPIERALRFYVCCWQSFQPGSGGHTSSWRVQKQNNRGKSVVSDWNGVDHLWDVAARLKLVQVENRDAFEIIKRYDTPTTLFYVDPPYVIETRSDKNTVHYAHEMNHEDHRRLASLLNEIKGMVVLSGYDHPLYGELYEGWRTVRKTSTTNGGGESTEVLWLSPQAVEIGKLPLFAAV